MARVESYRLSKGARPSLLVPDNALFPLDPDWPIAFDSLQRPPLAVHWSGQKQCLPHLSAQKAVAVVGTRRPSDHGYRMAHALGQCLARAGWPVVSGLAEGIDAASHHGCLAAGGLPVGVLGTPLDRVYPSEHEALQAQVESAGLLLSEWPRGARVQRSNFALRNRLLVSVSCALVVVECPETSGSLLSAQIAHTQNCPVWVVPGDALRWSSKGSNRLLQEGATPLLTPESLIASLGPGPLASRRRRRWHWTDPRLQAIGSPRYSVALMKGSPLSSSLPHSAAVPLNWRMSCCNLSSRVSSSPSLDCVGGPFNLTQWALSAARELIYWSGGGI